MCFFRGVVGQIAEDGALRNFGKVAVQTAGHGRPAQTRVTGAIMSIIDLRSSLPYCLLVGRGFSVALRSASTSAPTALPLHLERVRQRVTDKHPEVKRVPDGAGGMGSKPVHAGFVGSALVVVVCVGRRRVVADSVQASAYFSETEQSNMCSLRAIAFTGRTAATVECLLQSRPRLIRLQGAWVSRVAALA